MNMRIALAAVSALALLGAAEVQAQTRRAPAAATSSGIQVPDIPFTKFTLNNGLTVIVHEDHKAPIVAVNVWYHVGSRNEPTGRSGFAHLFEHLMFNGSENANQDWFKVLERVGATDLNGTTNTDRTNYFQTVPKAALDTVLFLEADRMGALLPAIDQAKLDEQRGVVQNEKRSGENQPYGKVFDLITEATYPADHPYGHTVIGSMDDLNAAKLGDVQDWFRRYYGPSNAVIVLAGDITPAEARQKVERAFGWIQPGSPLAKDSVWINKLQEDQRAVAYDRVAQPRLYRVWNVPQQGAPDADYLNLLSDVLVSDKTSRLYKRLVYDEQLATDVGASIVTGEIGSQFLIVATAKPNQDLGRIERIVDEELKRLLASGPTTEELRKVKTLQMAGFVRGLERVGGFGGKSDVLAENQVYLGRPDAYKETLARIDSATGAQLVSAGKEWLQDGGSYTLHVLPFPQYAAQNTGVDRRTVPPAGTPDPAQFPQVEEARLSNGLRVLVARRTDVPLVNLNLIADAGFAADQFAKPGTATLAMNMLDEGTRTRNALEISRQLAMLGANLSTTSGLDTSSVGLSTLKANLDPALDLFADVILNPAFPQADFERLKALQLAGIKREKTEPTAMGLRVLPQLIYGQGHAYSLPYSGSGTEASVQSLTLQDLQTFHRTWLTPNNATLVVVGDTTMAEIRPKLERELAAWRPGQQPQKNIAAVQPPAQNRIYLIDKPGAEQSVILAALPAPPRSNPNEAAIESFNTALGGAFTSRLNMNLREDKHWSYGARTFFRQSKGPRLFIASAPVQTDKTKESFVEVQKELRDITKDRVLTADEMVMAQSSLTQRLPGRWETSGGLGAAISEQVIYGLPADYWSTYAGTVRALTINDLNRAAVDVVRADKVTYVVVGDRARIEQGLRELNVGPIQVIDADGNPVTRAASR
ncbi:MAG TPA: pitrilysin family protein [Caulobacteraceae bacterium]|jgi:zinc protease